jgi:hypothetical protein
VSLSGQLALIAGPHLPCPLLFLALLQVITIFSLVDVVLQAEATALKYSAILKRPGLEKASDEEPED